MNKNSVLVSSIVKAIFALLLSHSLYFLLAVLIFQMEFSIYWTYLISAAAFHMIVGAGLIWARDLFILEETGEPVTRINISNLLTLIRITSMPTLFFMLLNIQKYPILPLFLPYISFIFITDFLDGVTARKLNQVTRIGKYLDSSSDYCILFFITIIFGIFNLIPLWFLILIILRLLVLAVSLGIKSLIEKKVIYHISFLGKLSIFVTMSLYVLEIAYLLILNTFNLEFLKLIIEYIVGAIVFVSLLEKIITIFYKPSKTEKAV